MNRCTGTSRSRRARSPRADHAEGEARASERPRTSLAQAIQTDDDATHLVFADWLEERRARRRARVVTDGPVRRVVFSPDDKRFAAAGSSVRVWTVEIDPIATATTTSVVRPGGEIVTP